MTKPSEALLLGLYNVIGSLARQGYEKGIFCCLAGSHSELTNLFVLSPLKQEPQFESLLPLPYFSVEKIKEVIFFLIFFYIIINI